MNKSFYRHVYIPDDGEDGFHGATFGGVTFKIEPDVNTFSVAICQDGDMYSRKEGRNIIEQRNSLGDMNFRWSFTHYNHAMTAVQNCVLTLIDIYLRNRYELMDGGHNQELALENSVIENVLYNLHRVMSIRNSIDVRGSTTARYDDEAFFEMMINKIENFKRRV